MSRHTIAVGWDHEVPLDEVKQFRDVSAHELEEYYGIPADRLTEQDIARFMVRQSHPSPRYLKAGATNLVFGR